jgi:hypothetical protein
MRIARLWKAVDICAINLANKIKCMVLSQRNEKKIWRHLVSTASPIWGVKPEHSSLWRGAHQGNWNRDATAISENCYQPDMSWAQVSECSSANWGNGNATRGETDIPNFQTTEHASLLTIVLDWIAVAIPRYQLFCNALQWFICLLRWQEKLTKLKILFLCS